MSTKYECKGVLDGASYAPRFTMNIVLISTYELGHQPFGLASPAAWLQDVGAEVICLDLSIESLSRQAIAEADVVAFYVPMHTATRMATAVLKRVQGINPQAHLVAYGLYAPVNEAYLRGLGVETILGGEFEQGLVDVVQGLQTDTAVSPPSISLERQQFQLPNRALLPDLNAYAWLDVGGEQRVVGYTETTRGCKHLCRHCPIVPVYNGRFRIVQPEIVLADVRQQVAAGAQHITFGDPDFFNGTGHVLPIVQQLHEEFPALTYDVTIKVEHLLKFEHYLPILRDTGCLFVTSAVESVDEAILQRFAKGHTRADFVEAMNICQRLGLTINPTFVTFTPWTTVRGYVELLALLDELNLVEATSPIQYAIRLLIPRGSKLLDLPEMDALIGEFDAAGLVYPWQHPDPQVDALYAAIFKLIKASRRAEESRRVLFERVWETAVSYLDEPNIIRRKIRREELVVPTLSEDWY